MRTSSVDVIHGRVVATPPKAYHMKGGCPGDAERRERDAEARIDGSLRAASRGPIIPLLGTDGASPFVTQPQEHTLK